MNKKHPYVGAHVPTQGGIENIFKHATYLNIDYVQCFTKNNRQWRYELFIEEEVNSYKKALSASSVQEVFSHASYLSNLASQELEVIGNSQKALQAELERCHQIGIKWTVIHPGSNKAGDPLKIIHYMAKNVIEIIKKSDGSSGILLENSAGQGSSIPFKIEDLGQLLHEIKKECHARIGVCIDTCHAFVAGYDISQKEGYNDFWDLVDKHIGIENVKVIHTNDSQKKHGSRVDRHAHIGKGEMGEEVFALLLQDNRLKYIPKILETPYEVIDDLIPDIKKLAELAL